MVKPVLNGNLKTILTTISIIIILFGLIGNYYVGNYRLNEVEKGAQDREQRIQLLEKQIKNGLNEKILKQIIGLIVGSYP